MAEGEQEAPPAYDTTVDEPPPAYATTTNEQPTEYEVPSLLTFGDDVGCTIYEIASTFENQSYGAKEDLWEKLMNNKSELTSFVEIYTVTMSLIALTLKSKKQTNKPPQKQIQLLTTEFMTKLPKNSVGQPTLSKEEYFNNIHNIFYNIHNEMTNDNPTKSKTNTFIALDMNENKSQTSKQYNDAADTHLESQESKQITTKQKAYSKWIQAVWVLLVILCIIIQMTANWGYIWFIVFFGGCCIQSYVTRKLKARAETQTVKIDRTGLHFGNYDCTKEAKIGILSTHFKFVSVTGSNIVCDKLFCKECEQFQSIPMGNNKIAIQTFPGGYVSALPQGSLEVNNFRREQFEIIETTNGRFCIKSFHGKYLSAKSDGTMHANSDILGESETFYICDINGKGPNWSNRFGGNGGGIFGALRINGTSEKISGVRVYGGTYVDSIEFQVNDIWKGKHGGNGGVGPKTLILEHKEPGDEEYFNKIEIRSGSFVDYIKFHTNKSRTVEAGGNGGKYSCIGDGVNDRLIDCKGRSGAWIDGLQFKWNRHGDNREVLSLEFINCPGKHGLDEFTTPQKGYECDGCKQSALPQRTIMYGCRICNYDLCTSCYNKR